MQAIFIFILLLLTAAGPVAADESAARAAQDVSDSVMSPFCPGRTLSGCASPQARELRSEIERWFESGKSLEDVREELVTRYGEGVLGRPGAEGFGLLAWAVPLFFVAGGLFLVALRVASRSGSSEQREPPRAAEFDSEASAELEQEIKNRILGG